MALLESGGLEEEAVVGGRGKRERESKGDTR